jgi:hypothetical protein
VAALFHHHCEQKLRHVRPSKLQAQTIRASNHPKHNAALNQLLLDASDPEEVLDHFHKEWKQEAIDG